MTCIAYAQGMYLGLLNLPVKLNFKTNRATELRLIPSPLLDQKTFGLQEFQSVATLGK